VLPFFKVRIDFYSRSIGESSEVYQAANLEAARIVVSDPEKFPLGSLMALWAELVLERSGVSTTLDTEPAGPLFNRETR
jgi:hypothetical protein